VHRVEDTSSALPHGCGKCQSNFKFASSVYAPLENEVGMTKGVRQRCTRLLHACSALCKCANWLCRTCTPHHTVARRLSVSLTQSPFAFPSNCRCSPPLTSYMPGRSIPCTRARDSSTHHRTLCAVHGLCTSGVREKAEYKKRLGSFRMRYHLAIFPSRPLRRPVGRPAHVCTKYSFVTYYV
jgi:hypothetical protein